MSTCGSSSNGASMEACSRAVKAKKPMMRMNGMTE